MHRLTATAIIFAAAALASALQLDTRWQIAAAPEDRIAYSQNGTWICGTPGVWSSSDLATQQRVPLLPNESNGVLDFIGNGDSFIVAYSSGLGRYRTSDGQLEWFRAASNQQKMRGCPTADFVAAGRAGLVVYNGTTGATVQTLIASDTQVETIEWTPDGQYLLADTGAGTKVFRRSDWANVASYTVLPAPKALAMWPDSQSFVYGTSNSRLEVRDLLTGNVLRGTTLPSSASSVAVSPNGAKIWVADSNGITCLDSITFATLWTKSLPSGVDSMTCRPDGSVLSVAATDSLQSFDGIWNLSTLDGTVLNTSASHTHSVTAVGIDKCARFAVTGDWNGTIHDRSLLDGWTLFGATQQFAPEDIAVSPTEPIFVTVGRNERVSIYSTTTGQLLRFVATGLWLRSCAISPDGKTIAVGGGGAPRLYRTSDLTLVAQSTDNQVRSLGLAFSQDGSRLACTGFDWVSQLRTNNMSTEWTKSDSGELTSITYSPDGQFVSYCGNMRVGVRRRSDGSPVWVRDLTITQLTNVLYSVDGSALGVTTTAKQILYLDPAIGNQQLRYDNLYYSIIGAAQSPDGDLLVLGELNTVEAATSPHAPSFHFPENVAVRRGIVEGGTLASLQDCDNLTLDVRNGLTLNLSEPPVWLEFEGTCPASPNWLRFSFMGVASTPGLTAQVEMWDFVAGTWDQVDTTSWPLSSNTQRIDVTATQAARYRATDGTVRARVRAQATGPVASPVWRVQFDKVVWATRP